MKYLLKFAFSVRMVLVLLCVIAFAGVGLAADFSADLVVRTKGDGEITGKIFVKGGKIRQEMTEEGETQIMIVRPDKSVTWMISPEEKMYMEIPYQSSSKTFEEWSLEKEKNAKPIAEETVSGFPSKKYEVIEDGEKTYFWISNKLLFPVKVEDSQSVMEYKNIKEGAVAETLFEVPAGFEKMTAPLMPSEEGTPKE